MALLAVVAVIVIVAGGSGGSHHGPRPAATATASPRTTAHAPFEVREASFTFVDSTRSTSLRSGATHSRRILTRVLYPAAPAGARLPGPFPLIVFGHGYALSPQAYWPLLNAWARAGYVVAAPVFPLENSAAPGGPSPIDLSNEPGDMSFVITRLLGASAARREPLAGLINANQIAVAGHADGGAAALAAGDGANRDHRVSAAVVMAGAEVPGLDLDGDGPPVLAIQGTADTVNPPSATNTFFAALAAPKFLLTLLGAAHTTPYTRQWPQLRVVEGVTLAFLARYLRGEQSAAGALTRAGTVAGVAALTSDP